CCCRGPIPQIPTGDALSVCDGGAGFLNPERSVLCRYQAVLFFEILRPQLLIRILKAYASNPPSFLRAGCEISVSLTILRSLRPVFIDSTQTSACQPDQNTVAESLPN